MCQAFEANKTIKFANSIGSWNFQKMIKKYPPVHRRCLVHTLIHRRFLTHPQLLWGYNIYWESSQCFQCDVLTHHTPISTAVAVRARMNNYISQFYVNVISDHCPKLIGKFALLRRSHTPYHLASQGKWGINYFRWSGTFIDNLRYLK